MVAIRANDSPAAKKTGVTQLPRSIFVIRERMRRMLARSPQAPHGAFGECDRQRAGIGVTAMPRFR